MNIIVTGNAGFVGQTLTARLLQEGHNVYGFDIAETNEQATLQHRDNFRQCIVDLRSYDSILNACMSVDDIEVVFHTAAIQPVSKDMDGSEYFSTNVRGAVNLLQACNECGYRKIVTSSSFSVYGTPQYLPVDENHPVAPNNFYGLSKLQAELVFEYYSRTMNFNVVVLRYDGIYGTGQTIPGFIQYLVEVLSKDESVVLFNSGKQQRDNVYVGDVAEANLLTLKVMDKAKYNCFNLGGGQPKTAIETSTIVKEALHSKGEIILSEETNELMGYDVFMDCRKAREILGYNPAGLEHNIMRLIDEGR